MPKTEAIAVRVDPEVKRAVERAAKDDERSISTYVERILRAHLKEKGYLSE